VIFGNTERSDRVVCPCDEARMMVGCCLVTVNVRVMTVVVAVVVSFKGSLSSCSFLGIIEVSEDLSVRSSPVFFRVSSESKSENTKKHLIIFTAATRYSIFIGS